MADRPSAASGGAAPTLGRYHLGEPLGGGPTGEVFRAKVYGVAGYERQYAVKRFHPSLVAHPAAAEALAAAARAYATVVHPHIARLAEYGVANEQLFVAVDLVNGVDLTRLLDGTTRAGDPLPRGAVLTMLVQIARAVGYAHARGVTHGGLAPTNVVVSTDGDPKVTDFGFLRARLTPRPADDPTLTARLPYLAPEQLDGAPGSPAGDVFVLAALAVEALTGERAFAGKSPAEIAAALRSGPHEVPDVPPPVWEVLRQAFGPPDARFPHAGAFADALEAAVKRVALPGGRADLAAAVKRVHVRGAELMANASGAVSFPLPAPPPSTPGVSLSALFPAGVPKFPPRTTLQSLSVPPPPFGTAAASPLPAPPSPPPVPTLDASPPPVAPTISAPVAPVAPAPVYGRDPPARPRRLSIPPPMPVDDPNLLVEEPPPRRRTRWPIWLLVFLTLAGGGYLVYDQVSSSPVVATHPDATIVAVATPPPAPAPAAAAAPDSAPTSAPDAPPVPVPVPVPVPDSGSAPVAATEPDAAPTVAAAPAPAPAPGSSPLSITSTPSGALVFLDGAPKGKTPVELPASADRHKLAVILPGHKLVRRDIAGSGATAVALEPADKSRGPAGIKVLKCSARNRFYVIVDGLHTGMLCPTDRIHVELGDHTVEIYDALSDALTTQQVPVRDTHHSVRINAD